MLWSRRNRRRTINTNSASVISQTLEPRQLLSADGVLSGCIREAATDAANKEDVSQNDKSRPNDGAANDESRDSNTFQDPAGQGLADYQSLIDLIQDTIHADSTKDGNVTTGESTSQAALDLVVQATEQCTDDQIAELLNQLRGMQDLQVTIEVRFITVSDQFFEQIGVDFDFNDDTVADGKSDSTGTGVDTKPGTGLVQLPNIELPPGGLADGEPDVVLKQGSFETGVPEFGGFAPAAGDSIGLAILSDIEAFFFLQAAQGETRTNVMQAPKVTLFDGQTAFVSGD